MVTVFDAQYATMSTQIPEPPKTYGPPIPAPSFTASALPVCLIGVKTNTLEHLCSFCPWARQDFCTEVLSSGDRWSLPVIVHRTWGVGSVACVLTYFFNHCRFRVGKDCNIWQAGPKKTRVEVCIHGGLPSRSACSYKLCRVQQHCRHKCCFTKVIMNQPR